METTLGHIIAGIIVIVLYLLLSAKVIIFMKYKFEGKEMNGFKFMAFAVKIIIIGAMLFNMYEHFMLLALFIQTNISTLITANYTPFVFELLWLVGLYVGACLLENLIGFKIIFPMVQRKIKNHRW